MNVNIHEMPKCCLDIDKLSKNRPQGLLVLSEFLKKRRFGDDYSLLPT